jgi:diguanylate cyclase (GGDEF)-like protein
VVHTESMSTAQVPLRATAVAERLTPTAALVLVTVAVYLTALFGLKFGLPGTNASPVWLAAGVELAAVLLMGRRALLGIFIGAVLAQLSVDTPLVLSLVQGVPDVIDPLIATAALTYFTRDRADMLTIRSAVVLIAFGAGVAAAATATFGITATIIGNHLPWSVFGISWLTWWLGDVAGLILVAPLIVSIATVRRTRPAARRVAEGLLIVSVVAGASVVAFSGILGNNVAGPAQYLIFALLTWIAFRLGPRLTLLAANIVAIVAIVPAFWMIGPFIRNDIHGTLLYLQASMSALGVAALILATVANERQQAQGAVEAARDELEEKVLERTLQLEELATRDSLTSLVNRRYFTEELERAIAHAQRGHGSALLFADLDRFKACNDTHGHVFGDAVLVAVATVMTAEARKNDGVARLGGDEFCVLLDGAALPEALAVSERMRKRADEACQRLGADVTLSCGVVVIDGAATVDGVLTAADDAMYASKVSDEATTTAGTPQAADTCQDARRPAARRRAGG